MEKTWQIGFEHTLPGDNNEPPRHFLNGTFCLFLACLTSARMISLMGASLPGVDILTLVLLSNW